VGWNAVRWRTRDDTPWSLREAVRGLPDATPGAWPVTIPGTSDRPPLPVRVVALRQSPAAAAQARRKARKAARDHGHTVSQETLEAADSGVILTTLPPVAADAADILERYRLRWPMECAFKRLKSLRHLDALRAFDPDLAQTYLLAKLLGAVLVDAIRSPDPDFFPDGFPVRPDTQRCVAYFPTDLGGSPTDRPGSRASH
jgi:hypothetical protein